MSGYTRQGNRSAAGKSHGRMKHTGVGSRMVWKPKAEVATDGSLGSDSCCQKDNSSLTGECVAEKMSRSSPKPALDTNLQQEPSLPLVKDLPSSMENLKLMPADDGSKHLGSVFTSDYSSKESLTFSSQSDSSHMHPITAKSQQEKRSDAAASVFTSDYGSKESLMLSSQSDPSCMHSITAKSQQGGRSDAAAETLSCASKGQSGRTSDMYAMPIKPSPVACFPMEGIIAEKGKQTGDTFQEKADSSGRPENIDHASPIMRFDICPKTVDSAIKLKAPLHVKNKEKRNQSKRSVERIRVLRPGMVLMKGYISCDEQISIVKTCRELGISDGGFYQPGYRDGGKLHLKMMCLGKNWDPESGSYSDTRPIDNSKPPGIPDKFHDMVKRAIQDSNAHIQKRIVKADAGQVIPTMSPDICIVNFYTRSGKLGLHQDKDESAESINGGLPVVSFSIGDSAEFLYGDVRDIDEADKVILESGDVLIFGGKSRRIFHGVTSILPNTAPTSLVEATDMCPGRLNLTFRQF